MKSPKTIEAKFRRSKIETKLTKLWIDASSHMQLTVLKEIALNDSETPIILYFVNESQWWVITNERIFVRQINEITFINLSDIERVELKKLFEGEVEKNKCTSVQLFVKNQYWDFNLEAGTWPLIYEILRFMKG